MAEHLNDNADNKMMNDDNFSFNVTYEDDTCISLYYYNI